VGQDKPPTITEYEQLTESEKKEGLAHPTREVVGALTFIEGACRPDISYALRLAAKMVSKPSNQLWDWIKRILRYLKGTPDFGITIKGDFDSDIQGFSDANHANDPDTRRSISSLFIKYGPNLISWKQAFQKIVSHSSTESELMSLDMLVRLIMHTKWKVHSLCGKRQDTVRVFIDNQSALDIASNPIQPGRNVHIHARYFYVRDLVNSGDIAIYYLPTDDQIADIGCAYKGGQQYLLHRDRILNPAVVVVANERKGVHKWLSLLAQSPARVMRQ
jgi:hypothetical protein